MTTKLFFVRNRLAAQVAKRRAARDIPSYLEGSLSPSRARNVEAAINEDDELAADCQFIALMQDAVAASACVFSSDSSIERSLAGI